LRHQLDDHREYTAPQNRLSQLQFVAIRWLYADKLEVNMQKLTRWGNSVGVRIPAHVLGAAGLQASDQVYVRLLDNGDIRVRPVKGRQPSDLNAGRSVSSDLKEEEEW
jgi:antitoxin component of MazEF toxin-antitoxin module